jgi:integrase
MEALRLRVQDLNFGRRELIVRDGKGGKDRRTLLPNRLGDQLKQHLRKVRDIHQADLAAGYGRRLWPGGTSLCPGQKVFQRPGGMGLAVGSAVRRAVLASGHPSTRHAAYPPSLLRYPSAGAWTGHRTIQELMGHRDVNTTMIYTHVLNRGLMGVSSPADFL